MNYKIIENEETLNHFIEWLPELLPNEQYYISLLARKKYNKNSNLTADKNQLKRVTSTKDRIVQKIRQMECSIGSFTFKDEPILQDNLSLYITPNPRDLYKAGLYLLKEISAKIINGVTAYNPHSLALNCIQTTSSRKIYFDLDIDFKRSIEFFHEDFEIFKSGMFKFINPDCLQYIRTRGGVHCLVKVEGILPEFKKTWYQAAARSGCELYDVTMNADNLIPVPGCVQGSGFSPFFIK